MATDEQVADAEVGQQVGEGFYPQSSMWWPNWNGQGGRWDEWLDDGPRFDAQDEAEQWATERAEAKGRDVAEERHRVVKRTETVVVVITAGSLG